MRARHSFALLALALVACQASPSVGDACARSGDCAAPLVCAIGRCRAACRASTDCTALSRCLVEPASGLGVCSLDVDSCATHDCPLGFVCRDDQCLNACGSIVSCPDGACVDGACVAPTASDAGPSPDAGTDAGADAAAQVVTTCPGATLIEPAGMLTVVPFDPAGRSSAAGSCDPDLPDAYYVLRLAERSLVVLTIMSPHGGALGWVSDCNGSPPPSCESYCQSYTELADVLAPGDHVFVVDDAEATSVQVVAIPIPSSVVVEHVTAPEAFDVDVTLAPGAGIADCSASGPTHLFWFQTCFVGPIPTFEVSSCGSSANVDLEIFDDQSGHPFHCGAADAACTTGGQTVAHDALGGATTVILAATGHTPSDVGAVHLHGELVFPP